MNWSWRDISIVSVFTTLGSLLHKINLNIEIEELYSLVLLWLDVVFVAYDWSFHSFSATDVLNRSLLQDCLSGVIVVLVVCFKEESILLIASAI